MRDFTMGTYRRLLETWIDQGYDFRTYRSYLQDGATGKFVILRHDVDATPEKSLEFAQIQAKAGVYGTYYFRAVPCSWNERIIREIHELGHEVGYHYESLTTCKGDVDKAYIDFKQNLERMRKLVSVHTICMHGSPRSPYDSKDIWTKYDYRKSGILGEPYLSTDFSQIFYLTDTGRQWDGYRVSVRDKVMAFQREWEKRGWCYHSTFEIIDALEQGIFPDRAMFTFHPSGRWADNYRVWCTNCLQQLIKNGVKRVIVKYDLWR